MDLTCREDPRHGIGHFVAPGPLVGTTEGFTVMNLSAGGISLLRVAPTSNDVLNKKGLDMRFVWIAVPLPERNTQVSALIEIVHRKRYGALEMIGARFEEISLEDCVTLYEYLDERDRQSGHDVTI